MKYHVKDLKLAAKGKDRIEWAERSMPVLRLIKADFQKEEAPEGRQDGGLPPCHDRDRQSC